MSDLPQEDNPPPPSPPPVPAPQRMKAVPVMRVHMRRWRWPGLVWALPLLAVLIGIWLVVNSVLDRGPIITVRFKSADGLEAGKTKIRYKDVDVGEVKAIALSGDRREVLVTAELIKSAADMLAKDTRFFVVRPRVSGGSVSGLGTLLSGPYIGIDIGASETRVHDFIGLESPPVVLADSAGSEFVLKGEQMGSLDFGSPVFFRHVKVGHVTQYMLNPDGQGVTVRIFIDAPHDRYVTTSSRFWHASGIDMSFDASGFKLSTESLASVMEGGLAFQEQPDRLSAAAPAPSGTTFALFDDRDSAMRPSDDSVRTYVMYFSESLRGLAPGSPVDMRGIVIGEVKSLDVEYGETGQPLRFPVQISIYPNRLRSRLKPGSPGSQAQGDAQERDLIDRLFASGMRGQLRSGNLLTGQLYIALEFFPEAPKAAMDWRADPPVMPTIAGGMTEIQETVGRVAKRIDRIPVDQLSQQVSQALVRLDAALASTDRLVKRLDAELAPEATATLREARSTLETANGVLSSDSSLQRDLRDSLRQISRSARSLATLTEMLERQPDALLFGKKPAEAEPPPEPRQGGRQP